MVKLLLLLIAISLCVLQVSSTCPASASGGDSTIYPVDYTTTVTGGEATYYGVYSSGGACTLDPTPPAGTATSIWSTVAIADNIWAGSKACGMCINITFLGTGSGASHPTGSHIVYVNNECPSCANNGIDLGQSGDGVWDMTWKAVPCPVTTGIQFWLQGANSYYLKLQVRNTRYPVYAVSILQNGVYNALVRTADNFFTAGSTVTFPMVFPLGVQVTSVTGEVITDAVASLTNGAVLQGSAQFTDCSGSSTSSGSATTTTTAKASTTTTTGAKTTTTTSTTGAKTTTTTSTTGAKTTTTTSTTGAKTTTTTSTTGAKTTTTTSTTGAKTTTTTSTTGAKTTTTTTGASSTTGSTATQTYIYQDAFVNGYQDYSWGTTNAAITSPVHSGTYSYGFIPASWSAAYFHCGSSGCIDTSKVSSLQFYIYSATAAPQLTFALVQGSAGVNASALSTYASVPAATWTKVTVTFAGRFNTGLYDGCWFQDSTGAANTQYVYLDDVSLVGK